MNETLPDVRLAKARKTFGPVVVVAQFGIGVGFVRPSECLVDVAAAQVGQPVGSLWAVRP